MNEDDSTAPRRWPLLVAGVVTLVWLALVVAVAADALVPGSARAAFGAAGADLAPIGAFTLAGAAPLALIWLVAVAMRERFGTRAQAAAQLAASLDVSDARIAAARDTLRSLGQTTASLAGQIDDAANALARQSRALDVAGESWTRNARQLAEAGDTATSAAAAMHTAIPDAVAQAEQLTALLTASHAQVRSQLADTDTMLGAIESRLQSSSDDAGRRAAAVAEAIQAMAAAGARATEALRDPAKLLSESVDAAFRRTAAAMDASRDGVHAQTSALLASVEQARVTLDQIGGEAARQTAQRLDTLLQAAHELGDQLAAQQERTREMVDTAERGFGVLDAKLGNAVKTSSAALEGMTARLGDARDAVQQLIEPLSGADAAVQAVAARVDTVGASAKVAIGTLTEALPAALPLVDNLSERLAALQGRVEALTAPMTASGDAIAAVDLQLADNRLALEAAAATLNRELDTARAALAEIETRTGSASLAASTQLIDVFARVREIAEQTAGTMRSALQGVVAEAEMALDRAGTARAESAFAAPVRRQLAEIEAATAHAADVAQTAAERIAGRLMALTETVAGVEARIGEADARQDVRLRDDIGSRSAVLIGSLKGAAVDIARLLALDIPDDDWRRFLNGDRGIITRRTVRLIDSGSARMIARHFEHDEAFRAHATRYIDDFEMLIHRVESGRDGETLALTLLSSDIGKLYVALAQGAERFR